MSNKVLGALTFLVGAALGSIVTWKLLETKYKQIAQEEINSVKETYAKRKPATADLSVKEYVEQRAKNMAVAKDEYTSKVKEYDYDYFYNNEEKEDTEKPIIPPYIISPSEFGELEDYDMYSYTYYADKVLADEGDEPMSEEEIDAKIGIESLEHFGEYGDDSVYVRNEELKVDFEILLDLRTYAELHNPEEEG